jgi:hypothetical protein
VPEAVELWGMTFERVSFEGILRSVTVDVCVRVLMEISVEGSIFFSCIISGEIDAQIT